MRRASIAAAVIIVAAAVFLVWFFAVRIPAVNIPQLLKTCEKELPAQGIAIVYPFDGALFPSEIPAPLICWEDTIGRADQWIAAILFDNGMAPVSAVSAARQWRPEAAEWEGIKKNSLSAAARLIIIGISSRDPQTILSAASISFGTSTDPVGDCLFFREVNLPFIEAVKDPRAIRWRFGPISSPRPPRIVLENIPTCANCHSFSADSRTLAMEVDSANDKGSYAILPVGEKMILEKSKIITWNDYRKEDGENTFGLLAQISPDGKHVICMVKDRSVFVPKKEKFFSQLFFPVKGILVYYRRDTGTYHPLPGADDPDFVQANPVWSPDGKYILFARARAYQLKHLDADKKEVLLTEKECREFLKEGKTFKYDLYRIPFNDGQGGTPEPLQGASANGLSNYFPKYSPDGKWIVFCRSRSFMLLQPDSELYIMPAQGGIPRRMNCNTKRMNSWHTWSSNSRWLVFSSKANRPYTQLFITHIDAQGVDRPAVLLDRLTADDRAANIPEFVKLAPDDIREIEEQFLDDRSFRRAGDQLLVAQDFKKAAAAYRTALDINPENAKAHTNLGTALEVLGRIDEAIQHHEEAIRLKPEFAVAHLNLGTAHTRLGKVEDAISLYRRAIEFDPDLADAHINLGIALQGLGRTDQAAASLKRAVKIDPENAKAFHHLGTISLVRGKYKQAMADLSQAIECDPDYADAYNDLGILLQKQGRQEAAADRFRKAIQLAPDKPMPYCNLAGILELKGHAAKAAEYYQKAIKLDPGCIEAYNNLGILLAKQKRFDEAIELYLKALSRDPDCAASHSNLGIVFEQLGRFEEARLQYSETLRTNPAHPSARAGLKRLDAKE